MRHAAGHGATRRHQRLRREHAAEHAPLAAPRVTEKAVLGDRLEVEAADQLRERRATHPAASRNAGITCSPNSSIDRITLSAGMRVRLHQAEQLIAAGGAIASHALDAAVRIADDHGAHLVQHVEAEVRRVEVAAASGRRRTCRGRAGAPPARWRACRSARCSCWRYQTTDSAAFRRASSFVSAQCTMVKVAARELTNFPTGFASVEAVAVELRCAPPSSSGGTPMVKESSPRPLAAGELVAVRAGRRDPQRRVRLLERLRVHAARRDLEVAALPLEDVARPRADDDVERLLPQVARVVRVDAEALQLLARRRASGAELEAPVRRRCRASPPSRRRGADGCRAPAAAARRGRS